MSMRRKWRMRKREDEGIQRKIGSEKGNWRIEIKRRKGSRKKDEEVYFKCK